MRWLKLAAALVFVSTCTLLLLESALQLAHWLSDGDLLAVRDDATIVLCVGDSHTRGRPSPDNYPAALETLLNERTSRRYRVINVGVPGFSTNDVRKRFSRLLDYYHPAIVLHWAGINNGWNHPQSQVNRSRLVTWVLDHSRVVRFVRVAIFYRRLFSETVDTSGIEVRDWQGQWMRWHVDIAGVEEDIQTNFGDELPSDRVEGITREDLHAMMQAARERSTPMYLITYPFWTGPYDPVNRAIREVSAEFSVPFVDSLVSVKSVKKRAPDERLFDPSIHPMPIVYREIAEDVYRMLVGEGRVTPTS